jgi:protease I
MAKELQDYRVAIVVENGFEEVELTEPRRALEEAGAITEIVSPVQGKVKGWQHDHWGEEFTADRPIASASPHDYDALLLPGGVMNPDKLRRNQRVLTFVRSFFEAGKPVAAICHGPWTLIDAGVAHGRRMTSYHSIQTDLRNAGVNWVDEEVVIDQNLTTSRSPADIPAFNKKMVEEFAHARQVAHSRH